MGSPALPSSVSSSRPGTAVVDPDGRPADQVAVREHVRGHRRDPDRRGRAPEREPGCEHLLLTDCGSLFADERHVRRRDHGRRPHRPSGVKQPAVGTRDDECLRHRPRNPAGQRPHGVDAAVPVQVLPDAGPLRLSGVEVRGALHACVVHPSRAALEDRCAAEQRLAVDLGRGGHGRRGEDEGEQRREQPRDAARHEREERGRDRHSSGEGELAGVRGQPSQRSQLEDVLDGGARGEAADRQRQRRRCGGERDQRGERLWPRGAAVEPERKAQEQEWRRRQQIAAREVVDLA